MKKEYNYFTLWWDKTFRHAIRLFCQHQPPDFGGGLNVLGSLTLLRHEEFSDIHVLYLIKEARKKMKQHLTQEVIENFILDSLYNDNSHIFDYPSNIRFKPKFEKIKN